MQERERIGTTSIAVLIAVGLGAALPIFGATACSSSSAAATGPTNGADASDASTRACAPGTITQPDQSCAPADFAVACAAGFAPDPSGYGCRDVLPAAACTRATRAALGQTSCMPVGDCTAAFPPPNATLFVSATGPTDATHFTTIGAAVAVAGSGAVIAVDSGTYVEAVTITQPVSILGKCAANVTIEGQAGKLARAIWVNGATGVTVSGVTIHGAFIGVSVAPNGVLTLKDSILDSNIGVGLGLQDGNGFATIDDVVIRNTQGDSEPGLGINLQSSSQLTMSNTELTGNHDTALRVSTSSKVVVSHSVISHTLPFTGEPFGRGLVVQGGGTADVSTTAFIANEENAIVLSGSTSSFSQIVVRDTQPTPSGDFGRAIDAFDLGNFSVDSSTFTSNHDATIIVVNATGSLSKSVIQDTQLDGTGSFGRGIALQEAAHFKVDGSAILGSHESAIAALETDTDLSFTRSFIAGTQFESTNMLAYGIVGANGPRITIANSEIDSCAGAAAGFGSAAGIIASSVIANNAIGLATTDDITLQEVATAPATVQASVLAVTSDTAFIGNQTRVTSGNIPIPAALGNVK